MPDPLREEAERLQYVLRSGFFYQRHMEFRHLFLLADEFDGDDLDWQGREQLAISTEAWQTIQAINVAPWQVFSHPEVLMKEPQLVGYYRSLAILPQKGVQRLAFGVTGYEEGRVTRLSYERALRLSTLFNRHISANIEADPQVSLISLRMAATMNYGTQVNGSWRNEIGAEGPRRVKNLLFRNFVQDGLVQTVALKSGIELAPDASVESVDDLEVVVFKNGYRMIFGSEPDISLLAPELVTEGAIEVKAGLDPAGALERYGAALKSFSRARSDNKNSVTILLSSCITDEVRNRIATEPLINYDFNLTQVLAEPEVERAFKARVKHVLHLE